MRPDGLGRVPTPRAALEILGASDDPPCEAHVMDGFDPATSFGPAVAARYDDHLRGDESAAASFLHDLAAGGRALELAIGTGRIALPLAALGVPVDGIELPADMVTQLRSKSRRARPATSTPNTSGSTPSGSMSRATTPSPSSSPRTTSGSARRVSSSSRSSAATTRRASST